MSTLSPYLFFDGNCAEAMQFYAQVLGGKLDMMRHDQAPPDAQAPQQPAERIMHARLSTDSLVLMASDWMAGQAFPGASGFSLSLGYQDIARARATFDALAAGGEIRMPFGETFWSQGFGMLADRYGTPWMVNVEAPAAAP
ncbi:VOC family protein [Solimonas terrae]|uniref:VOC family protein n=1 Tax=Solimonas terrae TaxID=1396819 RepID=A0A6M2BSJ3_9GAMM|nr:VOC family protein [Solimonas terrae]NGY04967.1 VOC family protein [Solimonas terrae]